VLIKCGQRTYGISPVDPKGFVERIITFCPSIDRDLKSLKQSKTYPVPRLQPAILSIPILIFIAALTTGLLLYQQLPERIAVHFDLHGNADRWGPRSNYLYGNMIPATITFILNFIVFFIMRRSIRNPKTVNILVLLLSLTQLLILYFEIDMYSVNVNYSHILPTGTVIIIFGIILIFLGMMYYKEVKK
jgi:uncharacterized membrane protein